VFFSAPVWGIRGYIICMSQILIAGCGYVGTTLGKLCVLEGKTVWGLRRRSHLLPTQIRPITADLGQPETLRSLPTHLEYLFYTAAADRSDDACYQATYVEGLKNLIKALDEQKIHPKRVFFTSSTAVYGQTNGEWIDENSPTENKHFSGSRLMEAERLLLTCPFPWTVVRLSGIYGPNRTRLLEQVKRGEITAHESTSSYTNRIHRDDCAGLLFHLMLLKNPLGLYIGSDHEPARLCDVVGWLAQKLDVQPQNMPASPSNTEDRFRGNKRCRNGRAVDSGYRFHFPTYREGYTALLMPGAVK
jgi:nucleoside-diphosphate-sugar epimerase